MDWFVLNLKMFWQIEAEKSSEWVLPSDFQINSECCDSTDKTNRSAHPYNVPIFHNFNPNISYYS